MSDNKQSSIDWLEQEFVKLEATVGVHSVMYELIEQAKAMHKEQTIKFAEDWEKSNLDCKEDLYNETFNADEA